MPRIDTLGSVLCAATLLVGLMAAGCPDDLLANAPCEEDENCPNDLLCNDEGLCVPEEELEDEEDGEEGEGEGEGEGEEGEGEGEGEEGEGEGEGDPCSFGDDVAVFDDDEELEQLAGCETIEGDLVLDGDSADGTITSLDALGEVGVVQGSIAFVDLGDVASHEGIGGIFLVTGDLEISGDDADEITEALESLGEVGTDLVISDTEVVTLRGFASLQSIGNDLIFDGNDFLDSFGDGTFGALDFIGGSVIAQDNPALAMCLLEAQFVEVPIEDQGGNLNEEVCG